jgi:hypothetical protein
MALDIQLGLVTILMAVLGGIVSAIALSGKWRKITSCAAFVVLGCWGMYIVIKQSRDSATASEGLRNALSRIGQSTVQIERDSTETARLQEANTHLQERLLKQSVTISSLARENVSQVTGAGTFIYFTGPRDSI